MKLFILIFLYVSQFAEAEEIISKEVFSGPGIEIEEVTPVKTGDFSLAPDAKYGPATDPKLVKESTTGQVESQNLEVTNEPIPKIEIIVDSSGSMGQMLLADKSKMYFMKKMLTRYMTDQYKRKAQTGLRVYGSRRRGDCSDNELIVPFDVKSLGLIEQKVAKLTPVGKTPLFKAVQQAAEDLKSYKGPKAIVVFTDGEDTCGGGPCKEGKAALLDPVLNTKIFVVAIGFKADSSDLKKIQCLGDTTVTANSEEDMFSAMGDIHQQIYGKSINLEVRSHDPTATVELLREEGGQWKVFQRFTSSFGTTVPPGKYQAIVGLNPPFRFSTFVIPPKKKVVLTVKGNAKLTVGFLQKILDVEILDKNMKLVHKFKSDVSETVPSGRWSLKISKQPFFEKFVSRFDVAPNGDFKYEVVGAGALKVVTPEMIGFYVYDNKNNLLGNYLSNYPFALPVGQYKIHVNEKCSFPEVDVRDDEKLQILSCKK